MDFIHESQEWNSEVNIWQGEDEVTLLVKDMFAEWTQGLDTRESMCSIFFHIRDIPYSLIVPVNNTKNPQEQLLLWGKGSCGAKHYLLVEMFGLRKLAVTLPVAHHLACRVQTGDRWILVDATWDLPLGRTGFPVNNHWDGISDTRCAVKPLKSPMRTVFCRTATNEPCRGKDEAAFTQVDGEKNHQKAGDQDRYYSERTALRTSEEVKRIRRFSREFRDWLELVRTST